MTLETLRDSALPRLSWCAGVHRDSDVVRALIGEGIEVQEDALVEGAWDGDFSKFLFDEAETLLGSGCRVTESTVRFTTATHPLERLYYVALQDSLLVSNSLAFILAQTDDGPDPAHSNYCFDFLAELRGGVLGAPLGLPTERGRTIQTIRDGSFEIDRRLGVEVSMRPHGAGPRNYQELHTMLAGAVERVCRNAADPSRSRGCYATISQVSRGYDSTAAAALAARHGGCREAATFVGSSVKSGEVVDDGGSEIGRSLGLNVSEHDRREFMNLRRFTEAAYFLCPLSLGDMTTAVMEDRLSGAMVTTGRNAERYWVHDAQPAGQGFAETADVALAGYGMAEFRLRAGCLHFPIPYIGAFDSRALHRIAASEELAPWRGGDWEYERPIARRIAEEAGVPRDLFGQRKAGGAGLALGRVRPETDKAIREYVESYVPDDVRRSLDSAPLGVGRPNHFRTYRLRQMLSRHRGLRDVMRWINLDRFHMLYQSIYLYFFHWGLSTTQERYRTANKSWLNDS